MVKVFPLYLLNLIKLLFLWTIHLIVTLKGIATLITIFQLHYFIEAEKHDNFNSQWCLSDYVKKYLDLANYVGL